MLSKIPPINAEANTITAPLIERMSRRYARQDISRAASADEIVPSQDIPPLMPGVHARMRNGSNTLLLNAPMPDAVVSASASARAATNAIKYNFSNVKAYKTAHTEGINAFART